MIRTLFTHEWLRTRAMLGVIAGITAALVLVGTAATAFSGPLGTVVVFFTVVTVLSVLPFALGFDYWRSAYMRQGYFTHTLPVQGSTQYWVRLLYTLLVLAAALAFAAVLVTPVVLLALADAAPAGMGVVEYIRLGLERLDMADVVLLVGIVVIGLLGGLLMATVHIHFSVSVGSEPRWARLGLGGPVLTWFLTYVAIQLLMGVAILSVPLAIDAGASELTVVTYSFWQAMSTTTDADMVPVGFLVAAVLILVGMIARTAWSWNHRVSLR